ncbi:DUF262 domain-containing protein [Rossellomorea sp. BNER]|uniref:DUF262 domain-containing protein n=1 Tax=Rossellomorea sp. BNER TaxID=2962031 RepID=UPI003AF2037C|nr:DUF262 domain-containing protein [Rossellomorea sp. BNER]
MVKCRIVLIDIIKGGNNLAILANEKHSIGDLFNNRNPFIIPKHQRAYSWENEEIEAFCSDISNISKEYFFGGVVSVHQLSENGPGRIYRIVDGQQRIATFTLLIAQLRNGFNRLSEKARVLEEHTVIRKQQSHLLTTYLKHILHIKILNKDHLLGKTD